MYFIVSYRDCSYHTHAAVTLARGTMESVSAWTPQDVVTELSHLSFDDFLKKGRVSQKAAEARSWWSTIFKYSFEGNLVHPRRWQL